MKKVIFIVIVLGLLVHSGVYAHDVWIEKKDGQFIVLYGHGDKHDPYDPSKVKEVKAYDSKGKTIPVKVKKIKMFEESAIEALRPKLGTAVEMLKRENAITISPEGTVSAITVFFDGGYWLKTTDGWKNISKREAKEMQLVESARHSLKYAKSIMQWVEIYTKPLGMKLEIVPASNPLSMKKGESLSVTVFYEGKPLEGAKIETGDHKELAKTDKNGVASVPIESGINVIVAKHSAPIKDNPDADIISISSTLTFEVK